MMDEETTAVIPATGAEDAQPSEQAELRFEQLLGELDQVVRRLESGEEPLEESLKLFERGVRIARSSEQLLEQAERRLELLSPEGAVSALELE